MVRIPFDFFVYQTISAFRTISYYFELIDSQIDKVKNEEWEKIEKLPKPEDYEEYQTDYIPTIQSHEYEFDNLLPRMVGYSFVMMLFSELEFRVNSLCKELKRRENLPLKINDFQGDLVERFSKYLIIANKPKLETKAKFEIKTLNLIRNCIVHNNGFLKNMPPKTQNKIRDRVKNEPHIDITTGGNGERIKVSSRFLYSKVEFFIAMFRKLFETYGFGPEYPIFPK
jgi:hypothetical protein